MGKKRRLLAQTATQKTESIINTGELGGFFGGYHRHRHIKGEKSTHRTHTW